MFETLKLQRGDVAVGACGGGGDASDTVIRVLIRCFSAMIDHGLVFRYDTPGDTVTTTS